MTDELDAGRKLVGHLAAHGFEVRLAFWVKETDAGRWYLSLASPVVDDNGPAAAYEALIPLVEAVPELGIDIFSVKLVGLTDSMAAAAWKAIRPRVPDSPFAVRDPKPYPGITRARGSTLGGVDIDAAYIYPPFQPTTPG